MAIFELPSCAVFKTKCKKDFSFSPQFPRLGQHISKYIHVWMEQPERKRENKRKKEIKRNPVRTDKIVTAYYTVFIIKIQQPCGSI